MRKKSLGVLAVIISAIIFGSMPLMARIVYREGGNAISLNLHRFILALPLIYFLIRRNKDISIKITKTECKKILILTVFGYTATALLIYTSYSYIPTGIATTLHFIYPIFVIIGSILFLKKKPNIIKISAVILCSLGIFMFYNGNGEMNLLGIILAFGSSITYAFYTVYLDMSGLKKMHTLKLTFYLCLVSAIIMFIFSLVTNSLTISMSSLGWLVTLILSILVSIGAVSLFQIGVKIIGPQSTSILSTFEPITGILFGILIFNETFGYRTILGFILVISAVVIISVHE